MNRKSFRLFFINFLTLVGLCLLIDSPIHAQPDNEPERSLEKLYADFRTALKKPCGARNDAVSIGRRIIELHKNDELNRDVIDYVKEKKRKMEREEKICPLAESFFENYRTSNWDKVFSLGKEIIAIDETNDKTNALSWMIDLAMIGFDRAKNRDDRFLKDSLYFAKKALEIIDTEKDLRMPRNFEPYDSNTGDAAVREKLRSKLQTVIKFLSEYK